MLCDLCDSLLARCCTEEARGVSQSEFRVFLKKLLVDAPVVLKHEGVVRVGNEEDIEYAALHHRHEVSVAQHQFM